MQSAEKVDWSRGYIKMAKILQAKFSNVFCWMKNFVFHHISTTAELNLFGVE